MDTFKSDISGNFFPVTEQVNGRLLHPSLLREIQKDHPAFCATGSLSIKELNNFNYQYIQGLLSREIGTITQLEETVLTNIKQNHLIADDASETKNPVTRGQRWADRIASFGGSWVFIGLFMAFILVWMVINVFILSNKGYDPYPFILLNLILSCLAAIQAPIIMMSQNRQEEKDRERAKNDYMVNLKSEIEIRILHEKMDHIIFSQQQNIIEIQILQQQLLQQLVSELNKKPNP